MEMGLRKDGGGSTGGGVSAAFQPPPTWQASLNIPSVNPDATPDVAANAALGARDISWSRKVINANPTSIVVKKNVVLYQRVSGRATAPGLRHDSD
jgi:hypothetical protein